MRNNFNIFVESDDKASKLKFDENNNMDCTIALPERFWFGDWQVCLKSLILPRRVWNVYEETMPKWSFFTNLDILGANFNGTDFNFAQGSYGVIDML